MKNHQEMEKKIIQLNRRIQLMKIRITKLLEKLAYRKNDSRKLSELRHWVRNHPTTMPDFNKVNK
jgi:hypothetical protein